jgi:hypothetical protein
VVVCERRSREWPGIALSALDAAQPIRHPGAGTPGVAVEEAKMPPKVHPNDDPMTPRIFEETPKVRPDQAAATVDETAEPAEEPSTTATS